MIISEHKETKPNKHWELFSKPLSVYKYSDVFEDTFYQKLKQSVIDRITNKTELTYLTHRTTFNHNNKEIHVASHKQNDRVQDVVYDLTFLKEYWSQNNETVYEWAWEYLSKNIHPIFYKFLLNFKNVAPFSEEPNSYIPFRWHLNYLAHTEFLSVHSDMNSQYFNTPACQFARARSLTFYLHDHVPNYGGELFFLSGFIHKPKQNEAVLINGNCCYHGINANMNPSKKPRLAFTTRWAHKDDLYLPGNIENTLYKVNHAY